MAIIDERIRTWSEENPSLAPQFREYFTALNTVVFDVVHEPDELSGLEIWFDASQESYGDEDLMPTFTDRSGNARNATGAGGQQPTFRTGEINGQPAADFNAAARMPTTSFSILQPHTFYIVFKEKKVQNSEFLVHSPPTGWDWIISETDPTKLLLYAGSIDLGIVVAPGTNIWLLASGLFNSSASWIRKNDEDKVSGNPGTNDIVGGLRLSDTFGEPTIAEFFIFGRVLTNNEEVGILNYINNKYNLW